MSAEYGFTVDPDPISMSAEDFNAKVTSVSSEHDRKVISDERLMDQIERAYIRLDPISTAFPQRPPLLSAAYARAAERTIVLARSRRSELRRRAADLSGTLLADKVCMDLEEAARNGQRPDMRSVHDGIDTAREMFRTSVNLLGPRKYDHLAIGSVMGDLTARALKIRVGTEMLATVRTAQRRRELIAMHKSALGGIVLDAIHHMTEMQRELAALPDTKRSNHKGHLTEMFAFAYKTIEWRQFGIGAYSIRFAFQREDHAGPHYQPRRTFDLMERIGTRNQPIEVKSGRSAEYHEEIDHWRPNHPKELEESYGAVTKAFRQAIVADTTGEQQEARLLLDYHFKQA